MAFGTKYICHSTRADFFHDLVSVTDYGSYTYQNNSSILYSKRSQMDTLLYLDQNNADIVFPTGFICRFYQLFSCFSHIFSIAPDDPLDLFIFKHIG